MTKKIVQVLYVLALVGCAGASRECSSCSAGAFGADWIVVQYRTNGTPINCWRLPNTSISNEEHSDGIYWKDPHGSHLVHISGWYNRAQVSGGDWVGAARAIGVDLERCNDGVYLDAQK